MDRRYRVFLTRRLLQIALAIGALVPILAGCAGVLWGPLMLGQNSLAIPSMDSHYRYLSGLLLGIGLGFWTTISDIERQTSRFRLLVAIVILGGLGRLYSLVLVGIPDHPMLFGLVMELFIVPLLALWQSVVAHQHRVLE